MSNAPPSGLTLRDRQRRQRGEGGSDGWMGEEDCCDQSDRRRPGGLDGVLPRGLRTDSAARGRGDGDVPVRGHVCLLAKRSRSRGRPFERGDAPGAERRGAVRDHRPGRRCGARRARSSRCDGDQRPHGPWLGHAHDDVRRSGRQYLGDRATAPGPRRGGVQMSSDLARLTNLASIACEPRPQLPDGFRRASTRIGAQLGAARTGLSVYELPPEQAIGPYHFEDPDEEWLLVVSGTPTLRHPGGEQQLAPWDVVYFPPGPAGAHQVRNTTESPARVAMFSSASQAGAVVYPDRDRVWMWTEDGAVDIIVERSS